MSEEEIIPEVAEMLATLKTHLADLIEAKATADKISFDAAAAMKEVNALIPLLTKYAPRE